MSEEAPEVIVARMFKSGLSRNNIAKACRVSVKNVDRLLRMYLINTDAQHKQEVLGAYQHNDRNEAAKARRLAAAKKQLEREVTK